MPTSPSNQNFLQSLDNVIDNSGAGIKATVGVVGATSTYLTQNNIIFALTAIYLSVLIISNLPKAALVVTAFIERWRRPRK